MAATLHLTTVLEPRGPAGAIVLTDEQAGVLGDGARTFPVVVTVGGVSIPLRVARMGGESLIGFSKAARAEAGIEIGDEVTVDVQAETGPRTVEVPDDLASALAAAPGAESAFASLAYTHRKEYVRWVQEAKRERTRADRVSRTVAMVREGRTR